jgi:hypothetical protein
MTIYGTLATSRGSRQRALYDRCRLNSGRKGYDGRKVANRLTRDIRLDSSEGLLITQKSNMRSIRSHYYTIQFMEWIER